MSSSASLSSSSEDEEEERKERHNWCRKDCYTSTPCILGLIVVASCYDSAKAFGTALCKVCVDVMGARTWRMRFNAMDEEGTLMRARFLSAGTLGLFTTLACAATAYVAGVNPTLAATGGVASTAALYLSARLTAGGLFASEGKNFRGPVYEKARRRWKLLFPHNTFPFITAALLQTLACLALGTPALRAELPLSLIPMANCKPVSASSSDAFKLMLELDQNRASTYTHRWGYVTMCLLEMGLLGNMFFIICNIAFGAFQGAAEQMERYATELEALKGLQRDVEVPSKLELVLDGLAERNALVATPDEAGARAAIASLVAETQSNFDRKREEALYELTGTRDAGRTVTGKGKSKGGAAILVRQTTGTGKDTRFIGGGPHAELVRGQYKADEAQAFQDQEEIGGMIHSRGREKYQKLLDSGEELDTIIFPVAVTVEDHINGRGLLVSDTNQTGFVRATVEKAHRCTSRRFIPGRAALAGALALLIVLIQLTVHWKLGSFATLTSATDVLALLVTPSTIQNYMMIFCYVPPSWALNYRSASGVLIGGVATYFIYRIKGTNEWFVVSRGEASDKGRGELSSLRYRRLPRGDDWDTTPDIYSYSLSSWRFFGGLSALWTAVCAAFDRDVKKGTKELNASTDARRAAWAAEALQVVVDGESQPKLVRVVGGEASLYIAAVYSNREVYRSVKLFLHADWAAAHFDALAKQGLLYDPRGKHSTTCQLFLVDDETDFGRDISKVCSSRHVGELKTNYCVLLLQPFVEALATFEGDPLSDEALEWRKPFSVFVPNTQRNARAGQFMVRPALKVASEAKEKDRRAALREAQNEPLPPTGEDGF